jgi:predicted MFS family arabinose efflux permease
MTADANVHDPSGRRGLVRLLGPVAERDFGFLWTARALSLIGDYTLRVALLTFVISATGSAGGLAIATTVLLLPALVFYLVGGIAGDRVRSRRRIMIGADLLCAAATGAMALVAPTGKVWLVVALAVLIGVGEGFFQPAAFAFVTEIVPAERRMAANSATSLARQLALVAGPAIGGFVVGFWSPAAAFAVDSATFVLSAIMVFAIRSRRAREVPAQAAPDVAASADRPARADQPAQRPRPRWRTVLADAAVGVRYVVSRKRLLLVFVVGSVANAVFVGNLDVAVPFVFSPAGVEEAAALGVFYTLEGVGAIFGAILLARLNARKVRLNLLFVLAEMAASLAAVGIIGRHPSAYTAALAYGVGLHFFNSLFVTMLHNSVPDRLMSRVGSLTFLCFNGLMPLGTLVMGPLVSALGARGAAVWTGLGLVVICIAGAAVMRSLGAEPADPARDRTRPADEPATRAEA